MTPLVRTLYAASFAMTVLANSLPYNPTRIFLPPNSSFAYIVDSTSQDDGTTSLLSLDLSQQIDTSSMSLNTITKALPAADSQAGQARSILQDTDGTLVSISGDCTTGANTTQIWRFTLDRQKEAGNGSWTQARFTGNQSIKYLADGMMFSDQNNGTNSSIYLFAGVCPTLPATASTWTSNATYSADMLRMAPSDDAYIESVSISPGGPVAEAGLSVTALPASVQGTFTQQQFVLIGGHTATAFINMSQLAIFSLPQEAWTFLPIQQELEVEPRSGHTALLTHDGSKIVVFGGWVGDISSAAQPQLAVLELGAGYGGSGRRQWTTPAMTGSGLPANSGLFGHGAAMLPGNVMMVYGGYAIAASSSKHKRDLSRAQPMLFNVTSSQWITSYNAPAGTLVQPSLTGSDMSGPKIGLAVGLSLGVLVLIALIVFYFWFSRRAGRAERDLMSRSSDGSQPFLEKNSLDGRGADITALGHPWLHNSGTSYTVPMIQHGSTTGSFVDNPSPTRGLRKGTPARGYQYHAAPLYDDKRTSRHSGSIHPIAEGDEDDSRRYIGDDTPLTEAERQLKELAAILNSSRTPEKTRKLPNPLRSHPVSPEIGESSQHGSNSVPAHTDGPHWTREGAEQVSSNSGRASPTKTDDRTSSTLSDRSQRSTLSDNSITRTMSTRTGALLSAAAAAHVRAKVVEAEAFSHARTETMSTSGHVSLVSRRTIARSSTNGSSAASEAKSAGAYVESFRTARSTTSKNEPDVLLDTRDCDDPYGRVLAADHSSQAGPSRRPQGLFGSLRKAIGAIALTDRTMSLASSRGHEYNQLSSTNSSPTKERRNPADQAPRRTVSDGGALLRQKRGRYDWADNAWPPYHDDPDPGDWGEPTRTSTEKQQAEEEWDVEDAAGKRDVQIMFTVPKSRLRVVNADMDRASLRSVSDGALSRNASMRARRYGSRES